MSHPTRDTLSRLVDEPAGVADSDRVHVASCRECLTALAARDTGGEKPVTGPARRWGPALRSPVVAGLGVLALLTGASAAAAADWLPIFRTEQVAPVAFTHEDLVAVPDLSAYGDVEVVDEVRIRDVATAAQAERDTGLDAPQVGELPPGVTGSPAYQVLGEVSGAFTFSADEARQTAQAHGEALPPPPPGLDGSRFRLEAGPGVAAIWTEERGLPAMVVARAVAPTAYSSGVSFETARDYLLSLPGVPEGLASQLRGFSADGATVPIPVPEEIMTSESVDVDGAEATLLETRDGAMAAVIWVEDGVVNVVAGSVTDVEALAVARGLG